MSIEASEVAKTLKYFMACGRNYSLAELHSLYVETKGGDAGATETEARNIEEFLKTGNLSAAAKSLGLGGPSAIRGSIERFVKRATMAGHGIGGAVPRCPTCGTELKR